MKRQPPEPKAEGCALWVVTFGDAMSLLVTFFVMLVSFASFEESALMEMVGAMKGGLRVSPVPLATSFDRAASESRLESAEEISRAPLLDSDQTPIDGNSMEEAPSRLYPSDSSDYFLHLLDNGVSLVIRSGAVFDTGTARIRRPDSDVWQVASILMGMVRSEVRILCKLSESSEVYLEEYSTAWGLGIEQALGLHRFLTGRFRVDPGQISTAVQVVHRMPAGEAAEGAVEIRYIGMDPLQVQNIPTYILEKDWRTAPPDDEETP